MTLMPRYFSFLGAAVLSGALLCLTAFAADDEVDKPTPSETKAGATKPSDPQPASNAIESSVVKVFAQVRRPHISNPWTKSSPREVTGSGMIIEGKRILTNAHVVLYSSQVQVQGNQSGDKFSANVEMIAPGIDLAILKVEDENFFEGRPPLARAQELPQVKDTVHVYGYPTGGTSQSITKGIISRIEYTGYRNHVSGLRIQIDAALNPGNSGGPALVGDKVVGLAFSHASNAQGIGYIIPTEEIELFLKDAADGRYDGKPALFETMQTLENGALRSFLKADKSVTGLVVREPYSSEEGYPLKQWDIVTAIGEKDVDDQGMVAVTDKLRVRFTYYVQQLAVDGKVPLTIVRGGKELKVDVPTPKSRALVIDTLQGEYPPYFIFGPIVFSVASEDILASLAGSNTGVGALNALSASHSPLLTRRMDKPAFEGEQLVVVPARFFPHKITKGYSSMMLKVIHSVNGIRVKNLKHLVEILRDSTDEYLVFESGGRGHESVVLPRAALAAATEEVLIDNGIRAQGSPEMLLVWNAGATQQAPAASSQDSSAKK